MKIPLTCTALLIAACCMAQTGYKIDLKIKGLKDTTVLLAYYYGDANYVKDTARVNSQGVFAFEGKENLPQGVYLVVLGRAPLFEIVISKQQHFRLETDREEYRQHMKVTGDDDNRLFFENMIYNAEKHKEVEPYLKVIQDSTLNEDQKKAAREAFGKVNAVVMAHQNELIEKYPATLTARMLKMTKPIQVPDPPKKADGSIDSTFQLRWYRQHFFDNFDLADPAMVQLPKPYYQEKLNEYLDKLFQQSPDTIMAAIDGIAARAKKNQDAYKYLVWTCVYKYQKPAIMGLDEVYVRLVDKYYLSGEMDFWISASLKKNLKDYADKLRGSLVGKTGLI